MVSIPPLVSGYGVPQQRSSSDVARGTGNAAAASAAETDSTVDPIRAALDAALKASALRQNGFAPLFADAQALVSRAGLPPDVKAAVQALLGLQLSADKLDVKTLANALMRSGLFLEAALGSGQFTGSDMKSALLNLRAALETWLGITPGAVSRVPPAPPYPGAPPAGQAPEQSSAGALSLQAAGAQLLAETDAALARQTMLQVVSMPDASGAAQRHDTPQRLTMEIPLLTPQGTAILALQVERDGRRAPGDTTGEGPVWRIGFSVHLEPAGPIHARIAQTGARTNVSIVAERIASAEALNQDLPALQAMLAEAALDPGELNCRLGGPQKAPAAAAAAPGRLLDRAT